MILLRYVLLGLAVCVLAAVGLRSGIPWRLTGAGWPGASVSGPSVPAEGGAPKTTGLPEQQVAEARGLVEKRLETVPVFAAFYQGLASGFPRVYDATVDRAARDIAEGANPPSADALLWEALRELQQSQGILAARAGEEALAGFFDARLAILDALAAADPRLCADFLYGTTEPSIDAFSAGHHDLVAGLASKQLAVIRDGQNRHAELSPPSPADLDLVASGLAARQLTPDEISVLLDGKSPNPPIADDRLCDMGRIYLSVLRGLPPDARQRVYGLAAELLARS